MRRYELRSRLNEGLVTVAMRMAHRPVSVFVDVRSGLRDGKAWLVPVPMLLIVELLTGRSTSTWL